MTLNEIPVRRPNALSGKPGKRKEPAGDYAGEAPKRGFQITSHRWPSGSRKYPE